MKRLSVTLFTLGLAGLAASCAGVDPAQLDREAQKALAPIESLNQPSWQAYQAALSAQAPLLEKIARGCASQTPQTARLERIACLEVSSRAAWWLSGFAEDAPLRGAGAASAVLAAADEARPLCAEEAGLGQCKALEAYAASAPARALAHRLEAGLAGGSRLSPAEALDILSAYADEEKLRWSEVEGPELEKLIRHDACSVSGASARLRSPEFSDELNISLRDGVTSASAAAARRLGLSLCAAADPDCELMAPCRPGGDAAACEMRLAAALHGLCAAPGAPALP